MLKVELCNIMQVMNPMYIYDCNRQVDQYRMYVINHYPYFHFLTSNTQLTTLLQTGGGHVLTYCLWDLFEEMTQ